jgi:hypothetical protein
MRRRALCHLLNDKSLWFEGTGRSEFLRTKHGGDEVEEKEHCDQADDKVFHGGGGQRRLRGVAQRAFLQNQAYAIARAKNATEIPTKTTSPTADVSSAKGRAEVFMPPG